MPPKLFAVVDIRMGCANLLFKLTPPKDWSGASPRDIPPFLVFTLDADPPILRRASLSIVLHSRCAFSSAWHALDKRSKGTRDRLRSSLRIFPSAELRRRIRNKIKRVPWPDAPLLFGWKPTAFIRARFRHNIVQKKRKEKWIEILLVYQVKTTKTTRKGGGKQLMVSRQKQSSGRERGIHFSLSCSPVPAHQATSSSI